MPEILDLGINDKEYLQLIAEGRDPVQERLLERRLLILGISPEEVNQLAQLILKPNRSRDEEMLVIRILQRVSV